VQSLTQNEAGQRQRDEVNKQEIIFFLGAGASVDAGIPDTYKFVTQFRNYVEETAQELSKSLSEILSILEDYNESHGGAKPKDVDVEQLLVTLERLKGKDDEILLGFYENKVFTNRFDSNDVTRIEKLLQDFIRKTVVVEKEEKLRYLQELAKFVPPTLEIFSVNYDTCVEQLCYLRNLKYTDGFDIYWKPQNLGPGDWDIKLFKLHGSVIWFESQTKEYLKIPIRTFVGEEETGLKLITGEDLKPLLVYPMQKWQYIEPLTELQLMFKKRLMDKSTRILVVVGYSFRDDYIIRMLWDAARINNDLRIVLLSPSAQETFERKLRYLDEKKTPSRIADRVVCLPYPFRTAIYQLKNHYLRHLGNCVSLEQRNVDEEKSGQKVDWRSLLALCIECEFASKAESVFQERLEYDWLDVRSWSEENVQERILLCMKALLHSSIVKDEFETRWLDRINKLFDFTNVENLRITNITLQTFSIGFNLGDKNVALRQILQLIEGLIAEIRRKSELLGVDLKEKLDRIIANLERLKTFKEYLDQLKENLKWSDYVKLRESVQSKIKEKYDIFAQSAGHVNKESLEQLVLQTERSMLKSIYDGQSFTLRIVDCPTRVGTD
jgi:DNA-binding ferritin-like protein (Dps family)